MTHIIELHRQLHFHNKRIMYEQVKSKCYFFNLLKNANVSKRIYLNF